MGGLHLLDVLDKVTIDWSDFDEAGRTSRELLADLADDKPSLRRLLHDVELSRHLLSLSERQEMLDNLVVYDALDRGFRIRFHIGSADEDEMHERNARYADFPHNHRSCFSTRILHGSYRHRAYTVLDPDRDGDAPLWSGNTDVDQPLDRPAEFVPYFDRVERPGDSYTLHFSAVHTMYPLEANLVTLYLRAPVAQEESRVWNRAGVARWGEIGGASEPRWRRDAVKMPVEHYLGLRDRLHEVEAV